MKGEKTFLISLIAMLFLSIVGVSMAGIPGPPAVPPPTVSPWVPPTTHPIWLYIQNYTFKTTEDLTGKSFNVSVGIHNVGNATVGLAAIDFRIGYNTTLLTATKVYLTSLSENYLDEYIGLVTPYTDQASINDTLGVVRWAAITKFSQGVPQPFVGNGTVIIVNFNITMAPPYHLVSRYFEYLNCTLDLYDTILEWINPSSYPYIHDEYVLCTDYGVDDGFYNYIRGPPVGGIYIPVNKSELLAPYIGLTTLLAVAVMTVGCVKKRKRQ